MEFDLNQFANSTPMLVLAAFLMFEIRVWRTQVIPGFVGALNAFSSSINKLAPGTVVAKRVDTHPMGVPVTPTYPTVEPYIPTSAPESSGGGR